MIDGYECDFPPFAHLRVDRKGEGLSVSSRDTPTPATVTAVVIGAGMADVISCVDPNVRDRTIWNWIFLPRAVCEVG